MARSGGTVCEPVDQPVDKRHLDTTVNLKTDSPTFGTPEAAHTIGYEKLVLDADHLGAVHTLLGGLTLNSESLALDTFREVGPGNHFFGCTHTLSRCETAFHACDLADTDFYENRIEAGGKGSMARANARWTEILRVYEPPPLDPSVDEALGEVMAGKKASDIWH